VGTVEISAFGPGRKTRCRIPDNFGRFSGLTAAYANLVYPSSESHQLEQIRSTPMHSLKLCTGIELFAALAVSPDGSAAHIFLHFSESEWRALSP
jgi:hypothetical protein